MSGHSKWSTIKRKKGEIDAARGKVFQKLAKEIYVAAKNGTPDVDSNAALRMVVEKAYGPSGVAFMVDCLTDNRNRTASQVRSAFTKRGGNLGTDGSVSYMFERKGIIVIEKEKDADEVMMNVLDNGALDFVENEDTYEIYTTPEDFIKVKEGLEELGVHDFLTSEVTYVAQNQVSLDEETKEKVYGLVETLEDIDDVQNVYHNMEE